MLERPGLAYGLILAAIFFLALARVLLHRKRTLEGFFSFLGRVEVAVVALLLFSLIFFGCLQIVLRNFFHSGIVWADPLMRHVVLWLGCFGGMMATSKMRHINIDVLTRVLPERFQGARDRIVNLVTALATSVLGFAALKLVIDERAFGETDFLGIGVWQLQTILPIAFFVISYRSLVHVMSPRKEIASHWETDFADAASTSPEPTAES